MFFILKIYLKYVGFYSYNSGKGKNFFRYTEYHGSIDIKERKKNRDVFNNEKNIRKQKKISIKKIMKKRPITVSPESTIESALSIMEKKKTNIFLQNCVEEHMLEILQKLEILKL